MEITAIITVVLLAAIILSIFFASEERFLIRYEKFFPSVKKKTAKVTEIKICQDYVLYSENNLAPTLQLDYYPRNLCRIMLNNREEISVCAAEMPGNLQIGDYLAYRRYPGILNQMSIDNAFDLSIVPVSNVAVGILVKEDRVFIARRGDKQSHPGLWEFPGGKIEPGETPQQAVVREFKEELNIEVAVLGEVMKTSLINSDKIFILHAYRINAPVENIPPLAVHSETCWAKILNLKKFSFLPADEAIINWLQRIHHCPCLGYEDFL